jgi:hypothetical protein
VGSRSIPPALAASFEADLNVIVILHNAKKGQAPPGIDVNNGTINRVVIDQLNVGKGTAVRITIGLEHKTDYLVTPAANGLLIDVRKKT